MPADFLINFAQDLARAARQQLFRQLNAHPFGFGGRAAAFAAHHLAAVRRADQGAQPQAVAIQFGIAADRHLAAAFQAGVHRPLGAHAGFGGRMVQRRQQRAGDAVVETAFNADRTLADRRQALFGAQRAADALLQPQALQAGHRQNNCVVVAVVQLGQASADVAAQVAHDQIRAAFAQLALAAQAGGADHAALRQLIERGETIGNKSVARIFAFANGGQTEPGREIDRHVFHRVHGDVGAAFQQRQLEFFNKQALTADFRQRRIQNNVAARHHRHQLDLQAGMAGHQTLLHIMCLPKCKRALSGGNSNNFV